MKPVSDPALLEQLNAAPARKPVSDPELLKQLNGGSEEPGLFDRIDSDLQTRFDRSQQYKDLPGQLPLENKAKDALNVGGFLVGDVPTEVATSAWRALPEDWRKPVEQGLSNAASAVANYIPPGGSYPIKDVAKVYSDSFGELEQADPLTASRVRAAGDLGNIALAATPIKGQSAVGAVVDTATDVAKTGSKIAGKTGRALGDALVPRLDETTAKLASRAQDFDIPLRLDQVSPTRARRTIQKVSQELPFSGSNAFEDSQRTAFNKALAKTLDADSLSPEGINNFLDNVGSKFNNYTKGVQINTEGLGGKLTGIMDEAKGSVSSDIQSIIDNNVNYINSNITDGVVDGKKLANVRSTLINRMKSADSRAKEFIGNAIEAIDDVVAPQIGKEGAEALSAARRQWRNYRTIEPLLEKSTDGMIDPALLMNRVSTSPYIKASRQSVGEDELVDLARIGKQFLPKAGGSDTTQKLIMAGGAGSLGTAALANPLAALGAGATAGAGLGANRAFQSLYNASQPVVKSAIRKSINNPKKVAELLVKNNKKVNATPIAVRQLAAALAAKSKE